MRSNPPALLLESHGPELHIQLRVHGRGWPPRVYLVTPVYTLLWMFAINQNMLFFLYKHLKGDAQPRSRYSYSLGHIHIACLIRPVELRLAST